MSDKIKEVVGTVGAVTILVSICVIAYLVVMAVLEVVL